VNIEMFSGIDGKIIAYKKIKDLNDFKEATYKHIEGTFTSITIKNEDNKIVGEALNVAKMLDYGWTDFQLSYYKNKVCSVAYDTNSKAYVGYSHRASKVFPIGYTVDENDMIANSRGIDIGDKVESLKDSLKFAKAFAREVS
jgi:hypothetical protein